MSTSTELVVKLDPKIVPSSHSEESKSTSDASVATVPVEILPIYAVPGDFPVPAQPLPFPLISNSKVVPDAKVAPEAGAVSNTETVPDAKPVSDVQATPANVKSVPDNNVSQAKCDKFCSLRYFGFGFMVALFLVNSEFARLFIFTIIFSGQYMILTVLEIVLYINGCIEYAAVMVVESTFGCDTASRCLEIPA
ncbi:hypothetical protein FRC09_002029 [Ceratobasidium sp. 395]|nr:hypothetical protein FRC09_002029 [Ceratobasidium sp. 395]